MFLADDHAVLRDGLRSLLEASDDIEVAGEAGGGREALEAIQRLKPDVAILDISMPELDGLQVAEMLHERLPGVRILILSMEGDAEVIHRALRAGAAGYLLKASAGREVATAVRAVHGGRRFLSDQVSERMIELFSEKAREKTPLESLSGRERQVLQLLAEGRSVPEIAEIISISPRTVETYRSRLYDKLKLYDIRGLILFAARHGIVRE